MRSNFIKILLALVFIMFSFTVSADVTTTMEEAFQKGNLVEGTYIGNFTTSTSTAYVLVKFPARSLNMVITTASSGMKVTAIGSTTSSSLVVTNSGTPVTIFNPNTTKTNWFDVKAYSAPSGWTGGANNMVYWTPSGINDAPFRMFFKNSVTNNYIFKLENTYITNATYGITFKFWY